MSEQSYIITIKSPEKIHLTMDQMNYFVSTVEDFFQLEVDIDIEGVSIKEGFKHEAVWPLCSLLEEAVSLLEEFDVSVQERYLL